MALDSLSDVEISHKDFVNRSDLTEGLQDVTPVQVRDLLEGLAGDQVTVTVSPAEDQRLLIAISDGAAFVALESGTDAYQFAGRTGGTGFREMVIEGQRTRLESRFVLSVTEAAAAAHEWLMGDEPSTIGEWVQQ